MDVFIAAQFAVVFTLIAYGFVVVVADFNAFILSVKNIRLQCLYFSVLTSYTTETSRTSVLQSGGLGECSTIHSPTALFLLFFF